MAIYLWNLVYLLISVWYKPLNIFRRTSIISLSEKTLKLDCAWKLKLCHIYIILFIVCISLLSFTGVFFFFFFRDTQTAQSGLNHLSEFSLWNLYCCLFFSMIYKQITWVTCVHFNTFFWPKIITKPLHLRNYGDHVKWKIRFPLMQLLILF